MTQILEKINGFVWGVPTLLLILGCGVYLTVITGCVQVRFLPKALKNFFGKLLSPIKDNNGISSYQALCTALAATVGTGNLAGVAGAIAIGGPGAVFWMWISAFFGMVTKFAEATLAVHFRTRHKDGTYSGGPMHMILLGMGEKWRPLAVCYCFFGIAAAFGVGNATQINTVISGVNQVFTILGYQEKREWNLLLGLVFAIIVSKMLAGGHADKAAGLQAQLLGQCACAVLQELGNAAGEAAVLINLDPAGLVAGLNFYVGQQLVDPLTGLGEVVYHNGLDGAALEGAEAAALNLSGDVAAWPFSWNILR